jgi:SAM-dependent methyltransferase
MAGGSGGIRHTSRSSTTALAISQARFADIGCGAGWSSIALASAYPSSNVLGVDVDEPSIQAANANAEAAGVADRTRFVIAAGQTLSELGPFDAASRSNAFTTCRARLTSLAAIHGAVRPDGLVVIMDEAVADEFRAPGDQVEQLMYGFSTLICLPDGPSSTPSEGTGTVMRRSILTDYAKRAGSAPSRCCPSKTSASGGSTNSTTEPRLLCSRLRVAQISTNAGL